MPCQVESTPEHPLFPQAAELSHIPVAVPKMMSATLASEGARWAFGSLALSATTVKSSFPAIYRAADKCAAVVPQSDAPDSDMLFDGKVRKGVIDVQLTPLVSWVR